MDVWHKITSRKPRKIFTWTAHLYSSLDKNFPVISGRAPRSNRPAGPRHSFVYIIFSSFLSAWFHLVKIKEKKKSKRNRMVYLAFFQPLVFSYFVQTDEELLILFSYLNLKVIIPCTVIPWNTASASLSEPTLKVLFDFITLVVIAQ